MKKTVLLVLIAINTSFLFAQSWLLSGNSNATSNSYIGTSNSIPIYFKTNSSDRMFISANKAYVGVGTTSPYANLHIHSTVRLNRNYTNYILLTNSATGSSLTSGFVIAQTNNKIFLSQNEKDNFYIENNGKGMLIDTNGFIGFGTNYPKQKIHVVNNNILITRTSTKADGSLNGSIMFGANASDSCQRGDWAIEYFTNDTLWNGLNFWQPWSVFHPGLNFALFLADNGNIGIGTNKPGEKLTVNGGICAKEVRVSLSGNHCWPDFVFEPNYQLMPLSDLESFIKEKKHLPNIPSEKEIMSGGVEVGNTISALLKNIEELTLHIIELEKRI